MAVAVITGTGTGIGLATAVAFGRAEYQTYATMRRPEASLELAGVARSENLPIGIVTMDVDDDQSVSNTFTKILAEAGRIDILVNNAGIHAQGATEELPLAEFRRVMETNYFGVLRCIQAVLPGMRKQGSGHIVNVSTVGGRITGLSQGPYSGSKFALEAIYARQAEVRAAGSYITEVAQRVTTAAFQAAGGTALFDTNPLQRCFRDIAAAGQHFMVSQSAYRAVGMFKLDQPDANLML